MNLNFVDFSTSLRDMIPSTTSNGPGGGRVDLGNETAFGDKLTALLSQKAGKFDKALDAGNSNSSALEFIDQFKRYLEMAGVVLENATIDQQGLGALNDLLIKAGFKPTEIKALMADLKDEDTDLIGLGEFMEGLESLSSKVSAQEDDEEILLSISDLPFISSILTTLGIPEDIASGIIADSKQEGVGIKLDSLIAGLKELQKQSFFSGNPFQANPETQGLDQMLQALGLGEKGAPGGPMTLDDFVSALEQIRASGDARGADSFRGEPLLKGADYFKLSDSLKTANPFKALNTLKGADELGLTEVGEAASAMVGTDPEELLSTVMKGVNRSADKFGGNGADLQRQASAMEGPERDNLLKLFGLKIDQQTPGVTASALAQGGVEPELAKLLGNIEAVAQEVKNGPGDLKDFGKEGRMATMAGEQKGTVVPLDASGGAGGEFREMAMDARNQAAAKAAPSRGNLPAYVTNQVGKSLARAVSQGESELKLQLKPPELGRLLMTIDNLGTSIKVSVITENQAARDILSAHANELKAHLANSGFSVDRFDVEVGSDFRQSMADARQQSSGSGSRRGRGSSSGAEGGNGDGDGTINTRAVANDAGALHFVA
ncbi:MAG: flagellar hook-length control protein FliK [Desulfobacterium sp.]|nr:flagellar hook-length control protein FliK [Desulfobacterium sp.]